MSFFKLFTEIKTCLSFAKLTYYHLLETEANLLTILIQNNSGPMIDPCGTPHIISLMSNLFS